MPLGVAVLVVSLLPYTKMEPSASPKRRIPIVTQQKQVSPQKDTSIDLLKVIRDDYPEPAPRPHVVDTPYQPTRFPYYRPQSFYADPYFKGKPNNPFLYDPANIIQTEIQLVPDSNGNNYQIRQKIGDSDFRPPLLLNQTDYFELQRRRDRFQTWRELSGGKNVESATQSNRLLIPKIPIESRFFNRVFKGDYIEFRPTGFVNLGFSLQSQKVANPSLPIRQQRSTNFLFDPHANIALTGKIGEAMEIGASFDTKAGFQFDNQFNLTYQGYEEDIIQKIEFGNVSFSVPTNLIQGSQNLFGINTELKFGRLKVRSVFANQRSRSEQINLQGGAQRRRFEIRASDYEENRHFFLGHYFRNNYNQWLSTLPTVGSGLRINRIRVFVTNLSNATVGQRNIIAYTDLGESDTAVLRNENFVAPLSPIPAVTRNESNNLLSRVDGLTNSDNITQDLQNLGLENGLDFIVNDNARELTRNTEFTVNEQLGYISLLTPLRNNEALAVAFEYSINGQVFEVGDQIEDNPNLENNANVQNNDERIVTKLLRPDAVRIDLPTWDLMMKNIYSLNANQVNRQNFQLRVVYKDDLTGIDNPTIQIGEEIRDIQLIQLLGLDQLNQLNDPPSDGNFDYIEGLTIDSRNGRIIFPVVEPFGDHLRRQFEATADASLADFYVFDVLYDRTRSDALQLAPDKNKFFISGSLEGSASTDVSLPSIVPPQPGSVRVYNGTIQLTENVDFVVDYSSGQVQIINPSINQENIRIDYEQADLFNFQTRRMFGTRLEYEISPDINFGATYMNLTERPVISRVNIGNEPVNNTMLGLDVNYASNSRLLTRLVDRLPLIQTKEESKVNFSAEYAQLFPGAASLSGEVSFIDDFEGNGLAVANLVRVPQRNWKLGSTPQDFPEFASQDLDYSFRRAKLAWYNIDNVFYRTGSSVRPDNVETDNHYVRAVSPQEIFPFRNQNLIIQTNEIILDLAYYPSERGPYNYNPNLNPDGTLPNPAQNFGSISRNFTTDNDFDNANVQYVEFWLMDPFKEGEFGRGAAFGFNDASIDEQEAKIVLNLGNVSEDVLPDGELSYENVPDNENVQETTWGRPHNRPNTTIAFEPDLQNSQDIGLDRLTDADEQSFPSFQNFLNNIGGLPDSIRQTIVDDPSNDNFTYFLDPSLDGLQILDRYKQFNGFEGNSPANSAESATNEPDNEDLNNNTTINTEEGYYQYEIPLRKSNVDGRLLNDNGYIINRITPTNNQNNEEIDWYLFRVPIRDPRAEVFGNISGFKSVNYMRMFVTGFEQPVVLRMAQFQVVSTQWRVNNLTDPSFGLIGEPDPNQNVIDISTVSVEENGFDNPEDQVIPYVLPPGSIRDRDVTSISSNVQLNERAMQLDITRIEQDSALSVFRNYNLDLLSYKNLNMFIHAQRRLDANGNPDPLPLEDGDVTAFVRLGTDFDQNFYEVEVPLTITPGGASDPEIIWPEANEINIAFQALVDTKLERNQQGQDPRTVYSRFVNQYRVTVVGNPDLSSVQVVSIGVRNPDENELAQNPFYQGTNDFNFVEDNQAKSVRIWVNELRITEFDQTAGWAAQAQATVQLADFARLQGSVRYRTFGFGQLEDKISERARETILEYDIAANINVDKLLPENWGLKIPLYVSYEKRKIDPRFNPLDPDTELDDFLDNLPTDAERDRFQNLVQDITTRQTINLTNVRKERVNPEAKVQFWDVENFAFSWAYTIERSSNSFIANYLNRSERYSLAYNFSKDRKFIEPFKNIKFLQSPWLKILGDFNFNLLPNQISIKGDLDRNFVRTQYWTSVITPTGNDLTTEGVIPIYQKRFLFNRAYNVGWNITRSISLNYNATVNAVIDEPQGEIDTQQERDSIWNNLKRFGRTKNFTQQFALTYRLPIDKIPLLDWTDANYSYNTGFQWVAGAYRPNPDTLGQQDTLGNVISNTRSRNFQLGFNLSDLYSKVKFLSDLNAPPPPLPDPSEEDSVRIRRRFTDTRAFKTFARLLLMVKRVGVTFSTNESTILPGFKPIPNFFGMADGFGAPGADFAVLGSQDPGIRQRALNSDWLVANEFLNTPFTQTLSNNLNITADVEPFVDFKVQLDARISRQINYQELFRLDTATNVVTTQNPTRSGSYTISTISIRSAFGSDNAENVSDVFEEFVRNRDVIRDRLRAANPLVTGNPADPDYALNSQDVLIPAFLAAYTGKSANDISLSPFPKTPLPNWRIDYTGLNKVEFLQEVFQTINLNHSYESVFSVNSYTSSLEYDESFVSIDTDERDFIAATETNEEGDLIPVYVINQVSIQERFSPLIGINVRTKNNMTIRFDYGRERSLSLNLSNAQITENKSLNYTFSFGYVKKDLKLPIRKGRGGEFVVLKNDVDFRLDVTVRDSRTIQRQVPQDDEASSNVITSGNLNVQIRPNISYQINNQLSFQLFYERTVNEPRISSSFRRVTSTGGFQLRYNLAQ